MGGGQQTVRIRNAFIILKQIFKCASGIIFLAMKSATNAVPRKKLSVRPAEQKIIHRVCYCSDNYTTRWYCYMACIVSWPQNLLWFSLPDCGTDHKVPQSGMENHTEWNNNGSTVMNLWYLALSRLFIVGKGRACNNDNVYTTYVCALKTLTNKKNILQKMARKFMRLLEAKAK